MRTVVLVRGSVLWLLLALVGWGCDSTRPVDQCANKNCDDGIACTQDDCSARTGDCEHQPDDGLCDSGQTCDPQVGCIGQQVCTSDADCDDSMFCNGAETCSGGTCSAGQAVQCADQQACTVDSCDASTDACSHQPDHTVCDDGQWCNGAEACDPVAGCQDSSPPDCDDSIDCTLDSCDEDGDQCVHALDDGRCDDLEPCNGEERCDPQAGCLPGTPVVCDDGIDCTRDTCAAGACVFTPDDGLCDDTNPCTADSCDLQADPVSCTHRVVPNGTSCADQTVCNGDEVCQGGMCRAGFPLICADDNPCTYNYCLPAAGCMTEPEAVGNPCPDGNRCNGDETCAAGGVCQPGQALDCDDGNDCTLEACLPSDGCLHIDGLDPCDDGDACTVHDRCQAGQCLGESVEICGDGLDNNCDGSIDEGCGGIGTFVAPPPFGNDANSGTQTQPLATISAGIVNALIIGAPQAVYVAGDGAHRYAEDLAMVPGVSVFGGYSDDGAWDYDPSAYPTLLAPTSPAGVKFLNAAIDRDTVLDGFVVIGQNVMGPGGVSQAVTVRSGAPTLSNNMLLSGTAAICRALLVEAGANPLVSGNELRGGDCQTFSEVIRVVGAGLDLQNNLVAGGRGPAVAGVSLDSVDTVTMTFNTISGGQASAGIGVGDVAAYGVVSVQGFSGLRLERNAIEAGSSDGRNPLAIGVALVDCGGAAAAVLDNPWIEGGPAVGALGSDGLSVGLMLDGDCPAQVAGNDAIVGSLEQTDRALGVWAGDGADCVIEHNGLIAGTPDASARIGAVGISCDANSCASVSNNLAILGGASVEVVGLALGLGSVPVVDSNLIFAGSCRSSGILNDRGVGVLLAGSGAELTNNVVFGGFCTESSGLLVYHAVTGNGQVLHANVNANYINGAGSPDGFFSASNGITLTSDGNAPAQNDYLNNIVNAGYATERIALVETNAWADPRVFDHNDLVGSTLAIYVDEGNRALPSIGLVNALGDTQTGHNLAVYPDLVNEILGGDFHLNAGSTLIDAGTGAGAPDHDFEGDMRPAGQAVDIGVDEAR